MNEWYSDWLLRRGEVSSSLADTLEQAIRWATCRGDSTADAPRPLEAAGVAVSTVSRAYAEATGAA